MVGWSECPYMLVFEGTLARSPQTPLESSRRVLGVLAPDVTLVAEAKRVTLAHKGKHARTAAGTPALKHAQLVVRTTHREATARMA